MRKIFLFLFVLTYFTHLFAFNQEQEKQIKQKIESFSTYQEQIQAIEKIIPKTKGQNQKDFLLNLKGEILQKNIKKILQNSFPEYQEKQQYYQKYFEVLQSIDPDASVNPYYLFELKKKIGTNDMYLKSFIYIFFQIKENVSQNNLFYHNYRQYIKDELQRKTTLIRKLDTPTQIFLKNRGYSAYSKNDLIQLKNYILEHKIDPKSKTFQYYKNFQAFGENFKNNFIFISKGISQSLQEKNLSCEANSASLFASYILNKNIGEKDILSHISFYSSGLVKSGDSYIWGNPNIEFVGDINGKQTKIIENMTGYGVHAEPISKSLEKLDIPNRIEKFNNTTILDSLISDTPVIFWYISRNSLGGINTTPITWRTPYGKDIQGYIGEHTGLITGLSLDNNGNIQEIYFYEGRNTHLQKVSYEEIAFQASFFNMIIVKK